MMDWYERCVENRCEMRAMRVEERGGRIVADKADLPEVGRDGEEESEGAFKQ